MWRWLYIGAWVTVRSKQPLEQMLAGHTYASLVPAQLQRLLVNRSSVPLKATLSDDTVIPTELTEQAREQRTRRFCGYDLIEFASTACAKEAGGLVDAGSLLLGREVRIANDEVWLRIVNMAEGYWHSGQRVPLVNDEGWHVTRDRGEMYNGKLTTVGRLGDLFFSDGEGIQPEKVEYVITIHSVALQVFIVPVADKESGHWPVAVVEYDQQSVGLGERAKDKLARFQQPVHRSTLPPGLKSGGIKTSYQALKEWVKYQQ